MGMLLGLRCLPIYEHPSGFILAFGTTRPPWQAKRQPIETKRRIPRQARAEETVAAILEGAAQVLEAGGLAAFTTNAVAERAGVSIGTLYQYFGDKNALIRALAERELGADARPRCARRCAARSIPRPRAACAPWCRAMITRLPRPPAGAQGGAAGDPEPGRRRRAAGPGRRVPGRASGGRRTNAAVRLRTRSIASSSSCCRAP